MLNPALSKQITLVEKAVADVNDHLTFDSAADSYNAGIGRLATNATKSKVTVPVTRLDTFFDGREEKPDVVKIDIEGAELRALEGMLGLFIRHPPQHILMEVHAFYLSPTERADFNKAIEEAFIRAQYTMSKLDGTSTGPGETWSGRIHLLASKISN